MKYKENSIFVSDKIKFTLFDKFIIKYFKYHVSQRRY